MSSGVVSLIPDLNLLPSIELAQNVPYKNNLRSGVLFFSGESESVAALRRKERLIAGDIRREKTCPRKTGNTDILRK